MKKLLPAFLIALGLCASPPVQAQACGSGGGAAVCPTATGFAENVQLNWTVSGNVSGLEVYRETDPNPSGRIRIDRISGAQKLPDMLKVLVDNAK